VSALDIEQSDALIAYLRARDAQVESVRVLAGGVSSRAVYVRLTDGREWVLKQSLAKLRVAVDWFSDPERIHNEARALRWLARLTPPGSVPEFIFEDVEAHVLAMSAVPQPHETWKTRMLSGGLNPAHAEAFGALLGTIHRGAAAHIEALRAEFGLGFFESLRVEPYYRYTATQVDEARDFLHDLIANTLAQSLTLVHGDYSPKNVLIYQGRLVLLDHEVAHVGDPAFDVGFGMTHLLSKAHHLAVQRSAFADAAVRCWTAYAAALGDSALGDVGWAELERRAVRHTLACLLARVAGRSPLEYLTPEAKSRQRAAVVRLMATPPDAMGVLIERFITELEKQG
jgi:aminoglycoside phosphotransferase (APT) family kinase protein